MATKGMQPKQPATKALTRPSITNPSATKAATKAEGPEVTPVKTERTNGVTAAEARPHTHEAGPHTHEASPEVDMLAEAPVGGETAAEKKTRQQLTNILHINI